MSERSPTTLHGRVWKFGDDVPTYTFVSPKHDRLGVARKFAELAPHLLEDVNPDFVDTVRPGDVVVAGKEFGHGKHHFSVVGALKEVGIAAVLAESIDPIFQRDAIDGGLPALVCPGLDGEVADGDVLELDLRSGTGSNVTRDVGISVKPCPPLLADILDAGGSMPWTVIREKGVRDQAAEREP